MLEDREVVYRGTAAAIALLKLGDDPVSDWASFLFDCARDRQTLHGLSLLPCARVKDGPLKRPVYAVEDVLEFIRRARALDGSLGPRPRMGAFTIKADPSLSWIANTVDRLGNPWTPAKSTLAS
jgi:hypothetical protein